MTVVIALTGNPSRGADGWQGWAALAPVPVAPAAKGLGPWAVAPGEARGRPELRRDPGVGRRDDGPFADGLGAVYQRLGRGMVRP
jgi:hypothetical protein